VRLKDRLLTAYQLWRSGYEFIMYYAMLSCYLHFVMFFLWTMTTVDVWPTVPRPLLEHQQYGWRAKDSLAPDILNETSPYLIFGHFGFYSQNERIIFGTCTLLKNHEIYCQGLGKIPIFRKKIPIFRKKKLHFLLLKVVCPNLLSYRP